MQQLDLKKADVQVMQIEEMRNQVGGSKILDTIHKFLVKKGLLVPDFKIAAIRTTRP